MNDDPEAKPSTGAEQRWQFRLRDLFALMTFVAIAAAVAGALGPGTLVSSAGFLIAWLNWRGACHVLQQGRQQLAVLGLAWLLFIVSMFLPSVRIFGPVQGYGVAWIALTAPLNVLERGGEISPAVLVLGLINIGNLLMALLPFVAWRLARGSGRVLVGALCVCMVSSWLVAWDTTMLAGYYVWCASFMLALAALPVSRRILAGMVATAAICVVILSLNSH